MANPKNTSKSNRRDLTSRPIPKTLTALALPMTIGIISMVGFNLVDTYFVGQLGGNELKALSFTFPVILIIFSIVQGIGIGATALIAKSIGQKNREKAARETTDSLILGIMITLGFVLLGLATMTPVFRLMGTPEPLLPLVREYMTIWYVTILFVVIPFVGNSAIRATGDTMMPSLIMLFAVIINAPLDYALIFGWGPFPALGLRGAALATAISRGFTMVLSLYILSQREKLITFKIPSRSVIAGCWRSILYIGLPTGFSRMIPPVASFIVTRILADISDDAVAAYGVGTRLEVLAMGIVWALSASMGPFVGQNLGAGRFDRIRGALNLGSGFSLAWGILAWGGLALAAKPIASIFTQEPAIIEHITTFLLIIPAGYGMAGLLLLVNSTINTLNKPLPAFALTAVHTFGFLIPLVLLGRHLFGITGIFGGMALANLLAGALGFVLTARIIGQVAQKLSSAQPQT